MKALRYLYLSRMKSPGTRHRLMAALMISSQMLLTAFVVYWLIGQYREERLLLHGQLKKEYFQVHDQLVDSMLLERLVLPSINELASVKVSLQDSSNQEIPVDSSTTVVMMKQFFAEVPDAVELHAIHVDGSNDPERGTRTIDLTSTISDEDRMVRSIKLFINENEEAFRSDTDLHIFAMNLDSGSLVLMMENVLEERAWPFAFEWSGEDPDQADMSVKHGIVLKGDPNRFLPQLWVQHYNGYLARSIFPQILFALILLLLSSSALLFAYRSLMKQVALNKLRDDFIGNISHELKTPVSTVKVALEALRTYDLKKDPRVSGEYLEMAASELERLEQLVSRVLHHEELNNPTLALQKESCDLNDLVKGVVKTLEIPIRKAGATVTHTDPGKPCIVNADRLYIEGVIINLIDNSLKYAGEGPEILIMTEHKPSGTILFVQDKGPGIPDEYREQIFEKFFRIPDGNKHNVKGYGMGLNFASQVMERHSGRISYTNLPGGGCRFTLQFPETDT